MPRSVMQKLIMSLSDQIMHSSSTHVLQQSTIFKLKDCFTYNHCLTNVQ